MERSVAPRIPRDHDPESCLHADRPGRAPDELGRPPWANDLATREVVVGHPLTETLRLVKERSADLLATGAFRPLGQFTGNGVGAFAAQCMRHVPCKVRAVHEDLRGSLKRVLVATDFSVSADRALEAAIRLVRQEAGDLHVIHVPDRDTADARAVENRLRDTVQRRDHGDPPLPVRYVVTRPREPGHEIIRYARKIEAHLIALGRHGVADLEYVLIGDTCERVLRAVRRSVLVATL